MEALRKIAKIKNGSISLKGLEKFDEQEVEIIVLPLSEGRTGKIKDQKSKLFQFKGFIESEFSDTSTKIDALIYGK